MQGKRFKARSIQKALAAIKDELGPDAMILSTRRVPKSPRDPYAEDLFEVEAAPKTPDVSDRGRGDKEIRSSSGSSVGREKYSGEHGGGGALKRTGDLFHRAAEMEGGFEEGTVLKANGTSLSSKERSTDRGADERTHPAVEVGGSNGTLFDELASIKDLISLVGFGSGMASILGNYPESAGIYASLLRAGISEKRAHWVLQKATITMESDLAERTGLNFPLKKYVIRECLDLIRTRELFSRPTESGVPHVAAFIGPTGVGKTTTIAKLAAELSIKQKKRVGLISIDSYRIGAFEQLKSYAAIMGLICIAAFNREDLTRALKKMAFMDIVLIDTAGHSHSDHLRMKEVSEVIRGDFNVSMHLVLSLTTGFLDMREAAGAFSKLNPETYVFTKVDETRRCGKIFDQISDLQLPVSLVTNGQRVPEDLIIPDARDLLGIMLGAEQGGEKQ